MTGVPNEIDNAGFMLGKMEGQLCEVIHQLDNMAMKLDGLTEKVIASSDLPAKVEKLDVRVTALEVDRNKRDGAMGFGGWMLKSPLLGWLLLAGTWLWAFIKGKV